MLVEISKYLSISNFVGYLKSKSGLILFDRHINLKCKYKNGHFWCRGGYFVDTVSRCETVIKEYIKIQLK